VRDILLSICISTFNRAAFLGETLGNILSQIPDGAEVVVLDGGSSDGTESVVRNYLYRYPQLRYFRQQKNQGVDRDFNEVVQLAAGTYCWLFTDDDLLKPGAIRTVLLRLRENPGLLLVNSEIRSRDFSEILQERALSMSEDRTYRRGEWRSFFLDVAVYASFIGCVVIRKDIWEGRERERYFGTEFIHVGVIFQQQIDDEIVVLADPLIMIRYGNAQWSPRGFEIWMLKWPKLIWSLPNFTDSDKARITPADPWRSIKELITLRAKGCYSLDEYKKWLYPRLPFGFAKVLALLVALLPGPLVNSFCLAYFSRVYKDAKTWHVDLTNSRFHQKNFLSSLIKSFTG
jgi:glycosyltransferase involved in cell wall biosynthesis